MQEISACLIFERMKKVLCVQTDKELREDLGAYQSTFSNWKNRNNLPIEVATDFSLRHNISLDWLILGKESPTLGEMETELLTRFNQLTSGQKIELLYTLQQNATNAAVSQTAGDNGINLNHSSVKVDKK